MKGSSVYITFRGRKYRLWLREDKYYANKAARMYRAEGYGARVLPDLRVRGGYEVWRTEKKLKERK